MAVFGKKGKTGEAAAPKAVGKVALSKQPKQPRPNVPPDLYTLLLGLSVLFLITATIILGLNYYWYQTTTPSVVPLTWIR